MPPQHDPNIMFLNHQTRNHKRVRTVIGRKELIRRTRRPLAYYASLAVIGGLFLSTLRYSITLVPRTSLEEWFGPPSMPDAETVLVRSRGVAGATGSAGQVEKSPSIPLDFQGPTSLDEQVLSAPSFIIDKRFFSADGAGHGHRDCRFSDESPPPVWPHVHAYMVNMFRAWSRFAMQHQAQYFILHGTLLGWHWNESIMDFDDDIDIGMTLDTMDTVLKPLNGTVFEGQYLVEINAFYAKRKRGAENAIDAEFIDILGGFKIDITAFSTALPIPRNRVSVQDEFIRAADSHQYKLNDIFPLQPTHLNGAPTFIPHEPKKLLAKEYKPDALVKDTFGEFRFDGSRWVRNKPYAQQATLCQPLEADQLYRNASAFFISWEKRRMLSLQTSLEDSELNAEIESQLQQVDVDNTISLSGQHKLQDRTVRVAQFNMQRGTYWCEAAKLIRSAARGADVIFVNGADWGMSRSGNAHTSRLLAQELGMNYAWGIEFLQLTPGNEEETNKATEAADCPENRRGIGWPGCKQDALGYTGNAILSKWPLTNVRVLRFPGINRLFHPATDDSSAANGTERRLGSPMALYTTIKNVPGYGGPIHLGCFHLQTQWDQRSPKDWVTLGKKTMLLMKQEHDVVIDPNLTMPFLLGGSGWEKNGCKDEVRFANLHSERGGGLICGRNVKDVSSFNRVGAQGISDHDLLGLKVRL